MSKQRSLVMTLSVAVLAVAAAGSAFADDPTPDTYASVPSVKTRAQVASELAQAKADGSAKAWSFAYQNKLQTQVRSEKARADVKADVLAARQSGELNGVGEVGGSYYLSLQAAQRARPARNVVAE
jgi:hypothetical protein